MQVFGERHRPWRGLVQACGQVILAQVGPVEPAKHAQDADTGESPQKPEWEQLSRLGHLRWGTEECW